jgi:hypothetical protein
VGWGGASSHITIAALGNEASKDVEEARSALKGRVSVVRALFPGCFHSILFFRNLEAVVEADDTTIAGIRDQALLLHHNNYTRELIPVQPGKLTAAGTRGPSQTAARFTHQAALGAALLSHLRQNLSEGESIHRGRTCPGLKQQKPPYTPWQQMYLLMSFFNTCKRRLARAEKKKQYLPSQHELGDSSAARNKREAAAHRVGAARKNG